MDAIIFYVWQEPAASSQGLFGIINESVTSWVVSFSGVSLMWYFLKGLPHKKGKIDWQLSSGKGEPNGFPGEEGVFIGIHLAERPESQWLALAAAKERLAENAVVWIKPGVREWVIDVDKLIESYPNLGRLEWLRGSVQLTPEYVPEPNIVTYNRPFRATVAFYLTPDGLKAESIDMRPCSSKQTGNIEILEEVSSGCYGKVFRARQTMLGRIVAVKVIKPEWAHAADAIKHAKAIARVDEHPNIVTVHGIETVHIADVGRNLQAVVMEWLDGEMFGTRLGGNKFAKEEVRRLCSGVISGLKHMHSNGIAHGDLHFGNIILSSDCTPKIIDIDATKEHSLGRLSTVSRAGAVAADVDYCRQFVFRVLSHGPFALSILNDVEVELMAASDLDAIREVFDQVMTSEVLQLAPQSVELQADGLQLRERVADLERQLRFSETLVRYGDAYWQTDESGERIGDPICSKCWDVGKLDVRLVISQPDNYFDKCPNCGTKIMGKDRERRGGPIPDGASMVPSVVGQRFRR